MAVSSSFKQKCPSCEAMVSIKDPSLVGKKVECSKCKYRFLVESPIEQDKAAVKKGRDEEAELEESDGKNGNGTKNGNGAKTNGKSAGAPAKADSKKRFKDEDLEEKDEKPAKSKVASSKKPVRDEDETPAKAKKQVRDDDDDDDDKAASGAPLKLILGLVLALVGVSVLAVAAWLILSSGGSGTSRPVVAGGGGPGVVEPPPSKPENPKVEEVKPKDDPVVTAGPEQTNLLPNDTEDVFHVFMNNVFGSGAVLRDAVFQAPGSLAGVPFKDRLGFDVVDVADLIRGEKYTAPAWSMTVLFLTNKIDEPKVIKALALTKVEPQIKTFTYYRATKSNPTLEHLARFSFGVPLKLSLAAARSDRPLYVYFHNQQTMVLADEEPLVQLLRSDGHLTELTPRPTAPAAPPAGGPGNPGMPMGPGNPGMPMGPGGPGGPGGPLTPGGGPGGSPMPGGGGPGPLTPGGGPGGSPMPMPGGGSPGPLTPGGGPGGSPMPGGGGPGPLTPGGGPGGSPMPGGGPGGSPMPGGGGPGPLTPGGGPGGGPGAGNNQPGKTPAPVAPPLNPRDEMYLTIKPSFKAMLDRLETKPEGSKMLFSAVTDLGAARIIPNGPEWKNQVVRIPRKLWDITYLLEERNPALNLLGASLIQRSTRAFQLRNELTCAGSGCQGALQTADGKGRPATGALLRQAV